MTMPQYDGPGLYLIENSTTGMVYVGKAIASCKKRLEQHANDLRSGHHPINRLQRDYDMGDKIQYRVVYELRASRADKHMKDYILSEMEWLYWRVQREHKPVYNKTMPTRRIARPKAIG